MSEHRDGLEITEIGPDDADLDAWYAVYDGAQRSELGEHALVWARPEIETFMREGSPGLRRVFLAGRLDGELVATGFVAMRTLDNLDAAEVSVEVRPDRLRRGLGTRMLAHAEGVARAHGRTRMDAEAGWRTERGPDGAGNPGRELLLAHGYRMVLGDVQRELALPVDDDLLAALAAEAAPRHADYTLRSWTGRIPDDVVESWLRLSSTLMTEAPMGEGERESETTDVAAFRASEAQMERAGRTRFHTVALDADGEVAAYTDIGRSAHEPGRCYQWGTLVRGADRGHRLGLAVKVANHRRLQKAASDLTRCTTWNAEVNDHMIAINERLGFRPVARLGEFQKRLAPTAAP